MPTRFKNIKTTRGRGYDEKLINRLNDSLLVFPIKQRASILGTFIEESGGNPLAKSENGTYQGLAQWGFDRYRITSDNPEVELKNQLDTLRSTINNTTDGKSWTHGGEGSGYSSLMDAYNDFNNPNLPIDDVFRAFSFGYVRPKGKDESYENRLKVVKQVYDELLREEEANNTLLKNPEIIHTESRDAIAAPYRPEIKSTYNQNIRALNAIDVKKALYRLDKKLRWENQPEQEHFVPTNGIDYTMHSTGGSLKTKKWDELSLREKSEMIGVAVRNGVTNLKDIRQKYNEFAEGGNLYDGTTEESQKMTRMDREKAWRERERNIAKSIVKSNPSLPNLINATGHYLNSIPMLMTPPSEVTGVTASEPLLPDVKNAAQLMKAGKVARAIEDAVKTGKNSFRTAVSNIFKKPAKKSDIIWDAEQMFKDGNNFSYTQEDIDILNSFIPEYKEIEKLSKANGIYLKMPDGSTWKGDPREWVIAQSKNVKDNYGSEILTHGNSDSWITKEGADVTGDILGEKTLWTSTNPYLGGTYGNKIYRFVVPKDVNMETVADAHGRYWRDVKPGIDTNMMVYPNLTEDKIIRINNVVDRGPNEVFKEELPKAFPKEGVMDYTARVFQGDDLVLGNKVRRKALLGNNGMFGLNDHNIFRSLIPAGFGIAGYKYSESNGNK